MTAIIADDLPTDPADVEQDASDFFDADIETNVEAVIILGQLDPLELADGQPRWTESQRNVILKAVDKLDAWKV